MNRPKHRGLAEGIAGLDRLFSFGCTPGKKGECPHEGAKRALNVPHNTRRTKKVHARLRSHVHVLPTDSTNRSVGLRK